jgi:hypothetical protein
MKTHNQRLSKTHSIPYWTTSVFSSAVTDLVLIYELVTSSASVNRWLTLYSWTLNYWTAFWILLKWMNEWMNEFLVLLSTATALNDDCLTNVPVLKVKVMLPPTVSRTVLSWNKAPIWGLTPDLYYWMTVVGLLMWGALSNERTCLSFARISQQ